MAHLILVKHAMPVIVPGTPPERWELGDDGRQQARALAQYLWEYQPDVLITSVEPKAVETGRIVAEELGLNGSAAPGLHEHVRTNIPFFGQAEWLERVACFFARPSEVILGEESAAAALDRFSAAVDRVVVAHPGSTIVIVAHGTVIALYVASLTGQDGFQLWRSLDLPSCVVLSLPDGSVERIVPSIRPESINSR
jgi:broad specificity phosphatase PhoE